MIELRTVNLTRYITPLREGGSLPALAEADDEFKYGVKFRGAGHGTKALISELIGGEVAHILGFKVPELVFLNLDEAFGRTEGDEEIQDLLRKIFGKKYSVVAVNNEEYSNILKEYKKNIDSGKIYKYIEEPHIETKDNKNTKIENTAETLFGKDCIIVE